MKAQAPPGTEPTAELAPLLEALTARGQSLEALAATFQDQPRETIVPARVDDGADERASRLLAQLAEGRGGALTIGATLGRGGMGVVHLGTQKTLGRKVAIKTVRPEHRSRATTLELLKEAWITGALEHPNVVPVYDISLDEQGGPVIVLKRIEGVCWSALLEDPARLQCEHGVTDVLGWHLSTLIQVCNALRLAHSRGIVHRDLKPDNVMIGAFGEVYLLDWGIAVSLRDDGTGRFGVTRPQELAGTPSYMAPEMLGAQGEIGEHTDVYLLGAVLHEIATGRPPHQGRTLAAMILSIARGQPELPESLDGELGELIGQAMALVPAARFASVEAFQAALSRYGEHRGSMGLSTRAETRREALFTLLGAADALERRLEVYHLFGECRFGFEQALVTWPGNEAARAGLRRAGEAMIDYELGHGDAKAAALLLAQMASPPEALANRVRTAEQEGAERENRRLELEHRHDSSLGRRTRFFLGVLFGVVWICSPLVVELLPPALITYQFFIGSLLATLAGGVLLIGWARKSMGQTALNRSVLAAGLLSQISQVGVFSWAAVVGVPIVDVIPLSFIAWFCMMVLLAVTVEKWMALVSVGYLLAFAISLRWRPLGFGAMAAANLVLALVMIRVWQRRQ